MSTALRALRLCACPLRGLLMRRRLWLIERELRQDRSFVAALELMSAGMAGPGPRRQVRRSRPVMVGTLAALLAGGVTLAATSAEATDTDPGCARAVLAAATHDLGHHHPTCHLPESTT